MSQSLDDHPELIVVLGGGMQPDGTPAASTLAIDRSDFGLTWNMPVPNGVLVGDKVKIEVDLEAIDEAIAKRMGLAA